MMFLKNRKWNGRQASPAVGFNRLRRVGYVLVAMLVSATTAQAQHFDALLFEDGGRVQLGGMDVECFGGGGLPGCDPNGVSQRVFEAELVETGISPGLVGEAEEPGFFSVPDGAESFLPYGDNLPGSVGISLDLILAPNSPVANASILFWDGSGGVVNWSAVPNGEYFEVLGNGGSGGAMSGAATLSGIMLDDTAANGTVDTHPDFLLHGLDVVTDPTIGFYALFGVTNVDGLQSSAAWSVVFDWGVEDEELHEMAIDSVATFVPEPGTGLLVSLGLVGMGVRRKQR